MLSKADIRKTCAARRQALNPTERADFDAQIIARCQELIDSSNFHRIHQFLPIPRQAEINTWPLLEGIWRTHPDVQVFVPRLNHGRLAQVAVTAATQFEPSNLVIPEPVGGASLGIDEPMDLIIVPLLGFDRRGHRVGYGGGYYDRLLASQPTALKVGLVYDCCRLQADIPSEPYDVPLDAVITESGILRFA